MAARVAEWNPSPVAAPGEVGMVDYHTACDATSPAPVGMKRSELRSQSQQSTASSSLLTAANTS